MAQFNAVEPPYIQPARLDSMSRYITRSGYTEQVPQSLETYSTNGSRSIKFALSSPDSFWDIPNSFFRMKVATTLSFNGSTDLTRTLCEGGLHALFRAIRVTTANGVIIAQADRYNEWRAIISPLMHSKEYVESNGWIYGDSADPWEAPSAEYHWQTIQSNVAYLNASPTTIPLTSGALRLRVGDYVYLNDAGAGSAVVKGTIKSITSDTAFELAANPGFGADKTLSVSGYMRNESSRVAARWAAARGGPEASPTDTNSVELCFNPLLPFFNNPQWFPLFLLRGGVVIELEMEQDAWKVLRSRNVMAGTTDTFTNDSVTITYPRYMARIVTCNQSIAASYSTLYQGMGVYMTFMEYTIADVDNGFLSNTSKQFNPGKRSCRHILAKLTDARSNQKYYEPTSAAEAPYSSYNYDTLAETKLMNLASYYFAAGSIQYPLPFPVVTNADKMLTLPNEILEVSWGMQNVPNATRRYPPSYWWATNTDGANTAESRRFVMCAQLSKTPDALVGLDLQQAPINATLTFDTLTLASSGLETYGRFLRAFITYDKIVLFQARQSLTTFV